MSKFDPHTDIPALTGKIAVVTGANRGIGYHIALELARRGATVYVAARSESAATDAIRKMEDEWPELAGQCRLKFLHLDLGTISSARTSAEQFLTMETELHILVHNAGLLPHAYGLNSEGIEDTMVTNHLAPFAFTRTVLPRLLSTSKMADVRVVVVASYTYKDAPPGGKFLTVEEMNDALAPTQSVDPKRARYDRSKLANVLFARALQQRFSAAGSSAVAMSVNPGDVATETVLGFVRQWPLLGGIAASCVKALLLTPAQGAHTPLFAAASRTVRTDKAYAGAYLVPYGKMEKIVGDAASAQLAENLWESSDRIVDSVLSRPS